MNLSGDGAPPTMLHTVHHVICKFFSKADCWKNWPLSRNGYFSAVAGVCPSLVDTRRGPGYAQRPGPQPLQIAGGACRSLCALLPQDYSESCGRPPWAMDEATCRLSLDRLRPDGASEIAGDACSQIGSVAARTRSMNSITLLSGSRM